jgi:antitoxin MazE
MRVTVKKWGNSAAIRIPAAIMEAAKLHVGETVDIKEEGGSIVIEPMQQDKFEVANLIAGITLDNLHPEINLDPSLGKIFSRCHSKI